MSASTYAQGLSLAELDKRIASCTLVLNRILGTADRGIPPSILQRCRGIAIFPGVLKAGAVVGISYGKGVVVRRDEDTGTWSKPAFFTIRGGSIGLQFGAESVDLVLLIMSERGVQALLESKFTLGADLGVTADRWGVKHPRRPTWVLRQKFSPIRGPRASSRESPLRERHWNRILRQMNSITEKAPQSKTCFTRDWVAFPTMQRN